MKLATKIAAGYGMLIALIVGVLTYQLSLFYQMRSINRHLSEIDFQAATGSLQLLRDLEQAEEFTNKFFVTGGDPDYASRMEEMRDALSQDMKELESVHVGGTEKAEVGKISVLWTELSSASFTQEQQYHTMKVPEMEAALSEQLTLFSRLEVEAQALIRATRLSIESQVQESSRAAQRAHTISWIAAAAALALSLIVSIWIFRSISGPLKHLTEGTRAVAEGKFFYQLDSSGRDELAQLAADFNIMTRRLSELDKLKKDFVSHVSHELKTPIASMQETIRLLLDEIAGPVNPQQRRFLELNLQSASRLSALIRNLLDVSRMDAGVMHYELKKHDLVGLVETAIAEFEAPLRERAFRLETQMPEQPVMIHCDGDRMIQVVGNLIGNAIKFAPRGSTLRVFLTHASEPPRGAPASWLEKTAPGHKGDGFAVLRISDQGPGIPDAEKEKIFEKFHQVSQAKVSSGTGAGLGLAIARTIIEAHGGAIWVEDGPGGGSDFYVTLTAGMVAEAAAMRSSAPI